MNNEVIFSCECEKSIFFFKTFNDIMSQMSVSFSCSELKRVKQMCFKISNDGIEIYSDFSKKIFTHILLSKNFFTKYEYNSINNEPLCIGIMLDVLKSSFKNVLRNDSLKIVIYKDEYSLFPQNIHFILNNNKGFSIRINIVQNITIDVSENSKLLTEIPSDRLSNLYKEIGGLKKQVNINIEKDYIKMYSTMIDIAENWVKFVLNENAQEYEGNTISLKSDYFKIISKISNFDSKVKMCLAKTSDSENLIMKSNIVKNKPEIVGEIRISINCKEM